MPNAREFKLPDVGEGLTEAEIVSWLVSEGDAVSVNQSIVEVETAKSVVELPSPFTGRVSRLLASPGDVVLVGAPIIAIEDESAPSELPTGADPTEPERSKPEPVLVGYGVADAAPHRRRLRAAVGVADPTPSPSAAVTSAVAPASARPLATPPVRALAVRLGVELASVTPSTPGPVSRQDVIEAAPRAESVPVLQGDETRVPIRGVRKATAAAMVQSAFTAPHAAVWLTADMTESLLLIERLKRDKQWAEVRVSPLAVVARALTLGLEKHPQLNSTWDDAAGEIVLKHHVNLGFAAATPRGLLVPNVKNAGGLEFRALCVELGSLIEQARANRLSPGALSGGTATITNLGPLGVDGGVPILNPGESAILAVGAIRPTPWVVDGELEVRQVGQLILSFDHRVADGAEAAELLRDVADLLSDPAMALVR